MSIHPLGFAHPWAPPVAPERPLWESLTDALWDDLAQTPSQDAVPTRVQPLLDGPADPEEAARRYENPVFILTNRLGTEGELYRAAVMARVIPAGGAGVRVLREAHSGSMPMNAPRLQSFLTTWWMRQMGAELATH